MPFQAKSIEVKFKFRDQTGSSGSLRAHRAVTDTLAAIKTAADALALTLLAASDCSLLGYNVSAAYTNDTIVAPGAGSRIERKAVLNFRTATGFRSEISVPGVVDAAINPAGGVISNVDPIAAVVTAMTGGGWTDNRGVALAALDSDYERFNATSRGMRTTDTAPEE